MKRGRKGNAKRVLSTLLAAVMVLSWAPESAVNLTAYAEETGTAPETSAPETSAPETSAPETSVPETSAPETSAPETSAPETSAPETSAPETSAPETNAPETSAPETSVPETSAPETSAPETGDPEMMIPETEEVVLESETAETESDTAESETADPVQQIQDLIDALPEHVTEDNREAVEEQLQEILLLYAELDEAGQEQVDITRCLILQQELDEANAAELLAAELSMGSNINITRSNKSQYDNQTITGTTTNTHITIDGADVSLTIRDLNLQLPHSGDDQNLMHDGIRLQNGATLHLTLEGSNTIKGGNMHAGIGVPAGCTLIITGASTGSLTVTGGLGAAGIGAQYGSNGGQTVGNIIINGGDIKAYGNGGGAGIGGATDCSTGSVEINGGTVYAKGSAANIGPSVTSFEVAAGIGGGYCGYLSSITINGGTVTAEGAKDNDVTHSSAIGAGFAGPSCGTIAINGGTVNAVNSPYAIGLSNDKSQGSKGSVTISESATINLNGGNIDPMPAGWNIYTFNGEVYDTSLTANQSAVFTINGENYDVTVARDASRPYYGKFSIRNLFTTSSSISGAVLTMGDKAYGIENSTVSGKNVSLIFGTQEYVYGTLKVTVYDTAVTGDMPVTLTYDGASWSGTMKKSGTEPYCGSFTTGQIALKKSDSPVTLTVTSGSETWTTEVTPREGEMEVTIGTQEYFYSTLKVTVYDTAVTGDMPVTLTCDGTSGSGTMKKSGTEPYCGSFTTGQIALKKSDSPVTLTVTSGSETWTTEVTPREGEMEVTIGAQEYFYSTLNVTVFDQTVTEDMEVTLTCSGANWSGAMKKSGTEPYCGSFTTGQIALKKSDSPVTLTVTSGSETWTTEVTPREGEMDVTIGAQEYFYSTLKVTVYDTAVTEDMEVSLTCSGASWGGTMKKSGTEPYCGSFTTDQIALKKSDSPVTLMVISGSETWTTEVTPREGEMEVTIGTQEYQYYTLNGTIHDVRITENMTAAITVDGKEFTDVQLNKSGDYTAAFTLSGLIDVIDASEEVTVTADGITWSGTATGGAQKTLTIGRPDLQIRKVSLVFKDQTVTSEMPVESLTVSRGGVPLGPEEFAVVDGGTALKLDASRRGILEIYLSVGEDTFISVTVPGLNGGNPIEKTVTIAEDTSEIEMYWNKTDTLDLAYGNIVFDGSGTLKVTYYQSWGEQTTKELSYDEIPVITQSNSGTPVAHQITIQNTTQTLHVRLQDININHGSMSAIDVKSDAELEIVGTNNVKSTGGSSPAIYVSSGAKLTLSGDGTLNAENTGNGAAIGATAKSKSGDIIINSGTVNATARGAKSAGIGLAEYSSDSTSISIRVTINGGRVTAQGGRNAAGIGGGQYTGSKDHFITVNITINGGIVDASGGVNGAGIGEGGADVGETYTIITINGGTVTAHTPSSGSDAYYSIGARDTWDREIYITGGSIKTTGEKSINISKPVLRTFTLKDVGDDVPITSVTRADGTTAYGVKDVYTRDGGKVYFWLNKDECPKIIQVNGADYVPESSGSTTYVPKFMVKLKDYTGKTYDGTALSNPAEDQVESDAAYGDLAFTWYQEGTALPGQPMDAGTYTLKVSYGGNEAEFPVTIAKKPLTITAKDQTMDYGGVIENSMDQTDCGALAAGDILTGITVAAAETGVGTHEGAITVKDAVIKRDGVDVTANYDITYIPGSLTVNRATPTVRTWPTAGAITYGQSLRDSVLTGGEASVDNALSGGEASVDGTFAWTTDSIQPAVSDSKTTRYSVTFTPDDTSSYNSVSGEITLTVNKAAPTVTVNANTLTYTGLPQTLVTGTATGGTLQYSMDGTDYSADAPAGTDAGSYTVYYKVAGDENHEDTESESVGVTISPRTVNAAVTVDPASVAYDGTAKKPAVTVKDGETVIGENEYIVAYEDNIHVGQATVTVTDRDGGNYAVSGSASFTITPAGMKDAQVTVSGDYTYTGTARTPEEDRVTVTWNGKTLTPGTDYTFTCADNVNAGTASVTVTGTGNYTGEATGNFTIDRAALSITAVDQTITYGGSIAGGVDQVTVSGLAGGDMLTDIILTAAGDQVSEENSIVPSGAVVKNGETDVTANYQLSYQHGKLTIERLAIPAPAAISLTYNGREQTGVADGTGYTLEGNTGTDAGTYTATATLDGNYCWEGGSTEAKEIIWRIAPAKQENIQVSDYTGVYDGKAHGITVNGYPSGVTVRYGTEQGNCDRTENPAYTDAGSYIVYYQLTSPNYETVTGSAAVTIERKAIVRPAAKTGLVYNGQEQTGVEAGEGYRLENAAAKNAGTYTAAAVLNENYKWSDDGTENMTIDWGIEKREVTVSIAADGGVYNGSPFPASARLENVVKNDTVSVILTYIRQDGSTGSEIAPTEVGIYTVTAAITDPNYELNGLDSKTFVISPAGMEDAEVTVDGSYTYNGTAYTPEPVVTWNGKKLVKDTDYTVSYTDNTSAGTASVTVTGKGNYTGEASAKFIIAPKPVTVTITPGGGVYGGSITEATAKLNGVAAGDTAPDVTLTYTGNANDGEKTDSAQPPTKAGTYTVTAGIPEGNYVLTGETTATFVVDRAESLLTVAEVDEKIYGDGDFTLEITGGEGREISYTASDETVATVDKTGRVHIVGAGEAEITVALAQGDNYQGKELEVSIKIAPKDIADAEIVLGPALTANGSGQTQMVERVTVKNSEGGDMEVTYIVTGNTAVDAGGYSMTITGTGNFTGTKEQSFAVAPGAGQPSETDEDGNPVLGEGKISGQVILEDGAPAVDLEISKAELIGLLTQNGCLTAQELAQVADGAELKIILLISGNVSAGDQDQIRPLAEGYTVGSWFDIRLYKQMGKEEIVWLNETGTLIPLTVQVPESLSGTDQNVIRTFRLIRCHEGNAEFLPARYDDGSGTLSFETDRFSGYAIIYRDDENTEDTESTGDTESTEDTENTGDTESTEDTENTGDTESTEDTENTGDTESTEGTDRTKNTVSTGGNRNTGGQNTTANASPGTGDSSRADLWLAMMAMCAAAIGAVLNANRKKKKMKQ